MLSIQSLNGFKGIDYDAKYDSNDGEEIMQAVSDNISNVKVYNYNDIKSS